MGIKPEAEYIENDEDDSQEDSDICSYCGEYTGPTNGLGMPHRHL
jgi:hypothetical protein